MQTKHRSGCDADVLACALRKTLSTIGQIFNLGTLLLNTVQCARLPLSVGRVYP